MPEEEQEMIKRYDQTDEPGNTGKANETEAQQSTAVQEDACRCKETSKMKPRELLGLMMNDLAFWKKVKKG
jgi:hypothetical protein